MDNSIRELVTLQIGHYANFVGTHWWNLQESSFVYDSPSLTDINHDYLFKEGLTLQRQETYTPRLLAIDFRGNLHSLSVSGSLYNPIRPEPSTSEALWDGQIELIKQLPEEKNEFLRDLEKEDAFHQMPTDEDKDICIEDVNPYSSVSNNTVPSSHKIYDLSNSVKVWSDYLKQHLHPNSIYLLDDNHIAAVNATEEGSWGFSCGFAFWQREEVEEDITDRIRMLSESCGSLQGFQILCDIHDGMGGITNGILMHLEDEYGSKDSITFATTPPHLAPQIPQSRVLMQASIVQSYTLLSKTSNVFLPLSLRQSCLDLQAAPVSFPHILAQIDKPYMSSSVLASFLDTVTLPYRVRNETMPLSHVIEMVTLPGCQVVGGSLALPLGLTCNQYLMEWIDSNNYPPSVSLTPDVDIRLDPLSEIQIIRGISPSRLVRPGTKLVSGKQYHTAAELYQSFLEENYIPPRRRVIIGARDLLKTGSPFPSIFKETITEDGLVDSSKRAVTQVNGVPCLAGMHQGKGIGNILHKLQTVAEKLDVSKVPRLVDEGMDRETWADTVEELRKIHGNYSSKTETESSDDEI
ncbi:Protein misato 1 [Halocaridina rubra]|uniref:Protein misato 1 n=1 Tax=Halocaridina rubra TaxID=373956 RepID=A0AAN8ZP94_HALRR